MTEVNSVLEFELDTLTEDAFELGADGLDPIILAAWRRLCSETLSELMNANIDSLTSRADYFVESASVAARAIANDMYFDDIKNNSLGVVSSKLAMSYARLTKLEHDKRAAETERLRKEGASAIANGVTPMLNWDILPIGFATGDVKKGELVSVQVGCAGSPTVTADALRNGVTPMTQSKESDWHQVWLGDSIQKSMSSIRRQVNEISLGQRCPTGCKYARWRTDGKQPTEPGYGSRCDSCKKHDNRPGYVAEEKKAVGHVFDISTWLPLGMNFSHNANCTGNCGC